MSAAEILLGLSHDLPVPAKTNHKPDGFADRTRQAVDDLVDNTAIEFNNEIGALREQLDDLQKILAISATKTKGEMKSHVELVCAGRDLTHYVRERIEKMRVSDLLNEEQNHA